MHLLPLQDATGRERPLHALALLPFWSLPPPPYLPAPQSSGPAPGLAAITRAVGGEGFVSPPLSQGMQQSFHIIQIVLFSTSLITETNILFF